MDFLELVNKRQSCRAYDPARQVEREKLEACLQAARLAPSACNSQPYHFTVATGRAAAQVGACTRSAGMNKFTAEVPAFVVVSEQAYHTVAAVGARVKRQDYRAVDIGIAVAYLTAQATALGISSCILGWFEEKQLQRLLGTRKRIRLVIALGYAKADDPLRPKTRRPAAEMVSWMEAGGQSL